MSLLQRVSRNSTIYTIASFLQKGISFFLLPIYTRYLSPHDYGILAVVGSIGGILTMLLGLSLQAAVTRYYFVYRSERSKLKDFWGTIITLTLLLSLGAGAILLLAGQYVLQPLYGEIPWTYVSLGISAVILQPVITVYLSILQTREQAALYALHNFAQFVLTVAFVLSLVVFLGWDAKGPLVANLITAIIYFVVALYSLREEYHFCFRWAYAAEALRYSIPLVPHLLASQIVAASDRIFLNQLVSTASAGLYSIASVFGGIVSIVADGANRAYVPASMDALQSNTSESLLELRRVGLVLVTTYSLIALGISLFAREIISLVTTEPFITSYSIVPWIAFGFVASGLYYLFVNILFFHTGRTWIVSTSTVVIASSNIALNYVLIERLGLVGAGMAFFIAQVLGASLIGVIGYKYDPVSWEYLKLIVIPICSFSVALWINDIHVNSSIALFSVKVITFAVVYCLFNLALWRDVSFLLRQACMVLKRSQITAEV